MTELNNKEIRCWICKRTYEESIIDFREAIMKSYYYEDMGEEDRKLVEDKSLILTGDAGVFGEFDLPFFIHKDEGKEFFTKVKDLQAPPIYVCDVCGAILKYVSSFHDDKISREELQNLTFKLVGTDEAEKDNGDTRLALSRSGMVSLADTFRESIDLLSSADFQKKLSTEKEQRIVKYVTDGLRLELLELEEELGA